MSCLSSAANAENMLRQVKNLVESWHSRAESLMLQDVVLAKLTFVLCEVDFCDLRS